VASTSISTDLPARDRNAFGHWGVQEKRAYLDVLSNMVWDIEAELARAKAERASLMTSLQRNTDPRAV
jgi:hypothetical protein